MGGTWGVRRGQARRTLALLRTRRSRRAAASRCPKAGRRGRGAARSSSRMARNTSRGLQASPAGADPTGRPTGGCSAKAPCANSNCAASSDPSASRCSSRTVRLRNFTLAKVRL